MDPEKNLARVAPQDFKLCKTDAPTAYQPFKPPLLGHGTLHID